MEIFSADRIFTGLAWLPDHAILEDEGIIVDVLPIVSLPPNSVREHFNMITPAFIDAQIYGASGKLFSAFPSVNSLDLLYKHCLKGGTHYFLPTVATNTLTIVKECIDAVKLYWKSGGKGVVGLHLEGPWINKTKRGAHLENLISVPDKAVVKDLLEYGAGVIKMITIAPEVCSTEVLEQLRSYNIVLSAGHSDATFSLASASFDKGIRAATHLFNAMSPLHHRNPGLPGAVFQHSQVCASIIADGHHVDFAMISIAKTLLSERLFLITDAVTETSEGPYQHTLEGDKYVCNGILSGSALMMIDAVKNCISNAGISEEEALRMATLYPARVLGIEDLGLIKKGYRAELVFMDKDWTVLSTAT